jgi:hypothetical protein
VNVFNVHYLGEVASWLEHNCNGFDFVYWNIMHDAWYFSIATLPDTAKAQVEQYLRGITTRYRDEIDRIIDFMNRGASTDGFMLRMKIQDLDRKRNQDFAQVAPEMAQAIGYNKNA